MARYTGPKCRYCRAEQTPLYLKGTRCMSAHCPFRKDTSSKKTGLPGADPHIKGKKPTDYGVQLREKQKLKRMYGLLEKQFKLTFADAARFSGKTGDNMLILLERRLDNVVYRLHFAESRSQAVQFISHGHIFVNGKRCDIPSFRVSVGDVISIRPESQKHNIFRDNLSQYAKKENNCVSWMSLDTDAMKGTFNSYPLRSDIPDLEKINEQLIVELYSR